MTEPIVNRRRIDKLRAIAFEYGLTNEDAKDFGKLSKTATWEALLEVNRIVYINDSAVDIAVNTVYTPLDNALDKSESLDTVDSWTATNFLEWVDFSQLIALMLASAGVFVLAMSMWRQINPLNLFPPQSASTFKSEHQNNGINEATIRWQSVCRIIHRWRFSSRWQPLNR